MKLKLYPRENGLTDVYVYKTRQSEGPTQRALGVTQEDLPATIDKLVKAVKEPAL